jgi:hypothetical protein
MVQWCVKLRHGESESWVCGMNSGCIHCEHGAWELWGHCECADEVGSRVNERVVRWWTEWVWVYLSKHRIHTCPSLWYNTSVVSSDQKTKLTIRLLSWTRSPENSGNLYKILKKDFCFMFYNISVLLSTMALSIY